MQEHHLGVFEFVHTNDPRDTFLVTPRMNADPQGKRILRVMGPCMPMRAK